MVGIVGMDVMNVVMRWVTRMRSIRYSMVGFSENKEGSGNDGIGRDSACMTEFDEKFCSQCAHVDDS